LGQEIFETGFVYLIRAAHATGMRVVAVSATDSRQIIVDTLEQELAAAVGEHRVEILSDAQVSEVVATFPILVRLAANARSRELLRRLVVVDLLVRSSLSTVPLSDVEAMSEIWSGVVRNRERRDRGLPDAREHALLRIADWELSRVDALGVMGELDADALVCLRRDGLLRASEANPWELVPQFAHDELRRYAVARVLLADGDPVARLKAVGAPRWALPAARLACQAQLAISETGGLDRFARVQTAFDSLVEAGFGARWGDVPGEALLALGNPVPLLKDAWPTLTAGDGAGLLRLLRLLRQRHQDENGIVDPVVAEPLIERLLESRRPWSTDETARTFREWLLALVMTDAPEGHPLRIRLRQRLVDECQAGETRLQERNAAAAAALAARTPEQIEADEKRAAQSLLLSGGSVEVHWLDEADPHVNALRCQGDR
jgi:hypothetical protein